MQCKLLLTSREHGFKLGIALQAFRHVAHRRPLYLVARTYPVRIVVVLADVIGLLLVPLRNGHSKRGVLPYLGFHLQGPSGRRGTVWTA
jgi:hypothetical protein